MTRTLDNARFAGSATDAEQIVNDLLQGAWKARAVHVAVELAIPDLVAAAPVDSAELARQTGADLPSLRKLLRLLASFGVLTAEPIVGGELLVGATELSDVLRADPRGVVATDARFQATAWHWAAWGALEHSIRTGEAAFPAANDQPFWSLIQADEDAKSRFNAAMGSVSQQESDQIPEIYDFTDAAHVVDVGGGVGSLLASIVERDPGIRGTLLDLPEVAEVARTRLAERGLGQRVTVLGGDFHDTLPPDGDVYVLKHVLHNWTDEQVVDILGRIREAMPPTSRVLIIDNIIDEDASTDTLFVDLLMLVLVGGGDRSRAAFTDLVERAGLTVTRSGPAGRGALGYLECRRPD
jgi:O-methyltransferase domain